MRERGYLAIGGQIIDATVVEARRPRLSKGEKTMLRDGGIPSGWSKRRTRQIDRDGRWTIKRGKKAPPPDGTQPGTAGDRRSPLRQPPLVPGGEANDSSGYGRRR